MRTIPFPAEIAARWAEVVKAANDIGGWFDGYSNGYGFGSTDDAPEDGVASAPPETLTLYENYDEASDDLKSGRKKKGDICAWTRDFSDRGCKDPVVEIMVGTFAIFRVGNDDHTRLNEGYEDSAGTENERFIADEDHTIVVYML